MVGAKVWVGVRPEKITMTPAGAPHPHNPANATQGTIIISAYLGAVTMYDIRTPAGTLIKVTAPNGTRTAGPALATGSEVWLQWTAAASVVLDD